MQIKERTFAYWPLSQQANHKWSTIVTLRRCGKRPHREFVDTGLQRKLSQDWKHSYDIAGVKSQRVNSQGKNPGIISIFHFRAIWKGREATSSIKLHLQWRLNINCSCYLHHTIIVFLVKCVPGNRNTWPQTSKRWSKVTSPTNSHARSQTSVPFVLSTWRTNVQYLLILFINSTNLNKRGWAGR